MKLCQPRTYWALLAPSGCITFMVAAGLICCGPTYRTGGPTRSGPGVVGYVSLEGSLTRADDPAIKRLDAETVEHYAKRLLTTDALDYFVEPFSGDFYMAPTDELSAVNLLVLLKTLIGANFVNSPHGMQFLPKGLAQQLNVELNAQVTEVCRDARGATVTCTGADGRTRVERVDAVVVATPAAHAAAILPQPDSAQREFLVGLPYARSLVVTLTLHRAPAERAMWLSVPDHTHPDVNVMILDHNKAPGRVPAGAAMVTIYWHRDWATRHWELADDQVVRTPDMAQELLQGHRWDLML